MKKIIRNVSDDGKLVQITIADERWYVKTENDSNGEIVSVKEVPSVTWIANHYPKGVGFYKWLANHGWDESEFLKESAGIRGHRVHTGISHLLLGNTIDMDDDFMDPDTGESRPLELEEYEALMSFVAWHNEVKPKMLANEITVFNDQHGYAGTVDFICEINGERWLIDFKTSKEVWPAYEIQLAAYKHAVPEELRPDRLAILQIGYKRNKAGFKFTEVDDQFDLFLAAQKIWQKESGNQKPSKKDYPTSLSIS